MIQPTIAHNNPFSSLASIAKMDYNKLIPSRCSNQPVVHNKMVSIRAINPTQPRQQITTTEQPCNVTVFHNEVAPIRATNSTTVSNKIVSIRAINPTIVRSTSVSSESTVVSHKIVAIQATNPTTVYKKCVSIRTVNPETLHNNATSPGIGCVTQMLESCQSVSPAEDMTRVAATCQCPLVLEYHQPEANSQVGII